MKRKFIKTGVIAGIVGMLVGSTAYAGTAAHPYGVVVGRFNGYGYTDYQTKVFSGKDGYIYSTEVGGKYKVDVRMTSSGGNGAWLRDVTDGTQKALKAHSKHTNGSKVRMQFSNDAFTPVTVYVEGYWKSN